MSQTLRVLAYHRVAPFEDSSQLNPRLISATPDSFEQQARHLSKNYAVVNLQQVVDAFGKRTTLPNRAVLITFDDAYQDLAQYAWPILQQLGLTATIFVPTAYPDHPERAFWWDRLYRAFYNSHLPELRTRKFGRLSLNSKADRSQSLRTVQDGIKTVPHDQAMQLVDEFCHDLLVGREDQVPSVLGWDQLRRLANEGVDLAPHTRTHPILTRVSLAQARKEIIGSHRDLSEKIGNALPVISYPNGDHDGKIVGMLKREGFRLGFTTMNGQSNPAQSDPLRLNRTTITPRTTVPWFRIRLWKLAGHLDRLRHPNRLRNKGSVQTA